MESGLFPFVSVFENGQIYYLATLIYSFIRMEVRSILTFNSMVETMTSSIRLTS